MNEMMTEKSIMKIQTVTHSRLSQIDFNNIPFGKVFTDHMFQADYYDGAWKNPRIEPYGKLELSPSISSLHYGQSVFEGMKSNRDAEGNALLFRADMNFKRINNSCRRMAIPELPKSFFMDGLRNLIKLDKNWIPTSEGSALYLRPLVFATMEHVGVKVADRYKFVIIASPVGPYYGHTVKVKVADRYVRAFRGGTGFAKAAGNYGATLLPMEQAHKEGYDQILWLDGYNFEYIHEIGTMNVFFQVGEKVLTPSTESGEILPGVTRNSAIQLLEDNGFQIEDRPVRISEIIDAAEKGKLKDAFGTGTAAAIAQIASIGYKGKDYVLPPVNERTVSNFLKRNLIGIRTGEVADPYGWIEKI